MERRWFVSYNSQDQALAEQVASALRTRLPEAAIFFAPASLRAGGYWLPTLAQEIGEAEVFLLLVGEKGLGRWQVLEYYEALDRDLNRPDRRLLFLLLEGQRAPGLPFLGQLHWTIAPDPAAGETIARLLDGAAGAASGPAEPWRYARPYLGLLSMTEADSDHFYGRETETAGTLGILADAPDKVALLIGNSGVGKSSLAQAGVIAALKRQSWLAQAQGARLWPARFAESRRWLFLRMTPGEKPVAELVHQFENEWQYDTTDPDAEKRRGAWVANLLDGSATLAGLVTATLKRLAEIGREAPTGFFLYIDQGEELYVRAEPVERRRFSEILAEGVKDPRLSILMSMRADFTGELHADRALFDAHYRIDVPPVRAETLKTIVEEPARRLGARFDPPHLGADIAARADEESTADAGALTLMSYMLEDMWSDMVKRGDGVMRLRADAIELGRVLAQRADAFFETHRAAEKNIERIFTLKLASVREDGEPVRRRALRTEFSETDWRLVSELADAPNRLIVTAQREGRETWAEVAHEAIFKRWSRLRDWIGARQSFLVWKTGIEGKRREWTAADESDDLLLRGAPLVQAQAWLAAQAEDLDQAERDFIARSGAAEAALREREKAEREQRETLQKRLLRGAFAALIALSIVGGAVVWKWREAEQQKKETQKQAEIAKRNFDAAKRAVDVLTFDIAQGLRDVDGMRTATIMRILDRVRGVVDRLAQSAPDNPELQRSREVMLNEIGNTLIAQGAVADALARYREAFQIGEALAARDPANTLWQRDLSISQEKIGNMLRAQGDAAGALEAYRKSLAAREKLAARDPDNAELQRDLSVSQNKIGDVLRDQGEAAGALDAYRKGLVTAEALATRAPANTLWQRDLSVSHNKIGDVLRDHGDSAAALEAYKKGLVIAETLAARDSANTLWQRDLSISHERIGDVLRDQGDAGAALQSYRKSLEIREAPAARDPSNRLWQSDLSVSHEKIGDVLRDQGKTAAALQSYRKSLAIRETLAARDPANSQWRRDLSLSHNKVGDMLRDQGDAAGALAAYRKGLAIAETLAARDPANAQWQRDLAISHERIGDQSRASGDTAQAVGSYQKALNIYRSLRQRNSDDLQSEILSVVPLWRLGNLKGAEGRGDLEAALGILRPLAAAGRLDAKRRGWIPTIEADLAKLDAK
ncbi:MAG TPA: toll/interleukin-1 receptor domain-containing protein [Rhodoblastus sp.]|nr:toll/interleukin-1 receptor domain-containing protein [Rhodoblastus sp.]